MSNQAAIDALNKKRDEDIAEYVFIGGDHRVPDDTRPCGYRYTMPVDVAAKRCNVTVRTIVRWRATLRARETEGMEVNA